MGSMHVDMAPWVPDEAAPAGETATMASRRIKKSFA